MFDRLRSGVKGLVNKISTTELKPETLRNILSEFQMDLVENDVAFSVAELICSELEKRLTGLQIKRFEDRSVIIKKNLREIIIELIHVENGKSIIAIAENRNKKEPFSILFVGINGNGKTTTIAKVTNFLKKRSYSVVLAGSDTYRAGSIEQLQEHAANLKVRVIKHKYGADPTAVAFDAINHAKAQGIDFVLIDTSGRMQTNRNLMGELSKIKRITNPKLTILIVDSLTGNDAIIQAEEFQEKIGIDGVILTKTDADIKGGTALSVIYVTKKPILFIGNGQNYNDIKEFDPIEFTDMILK